MQKTTKTDEEKSRLLKLFFADLQIKVARKLNRRYVNDQQMADFLKASPASYSRWNSKEGITYPEPNTAFMINFVLAEKGFFDEGLELLDILDLPSVVAIDDPDLISLVKMWKYVSGEAKETIRNLIDDHKKTRGNDGDEKVGSREGVGGTKQG